MAVTASQLRQNIYRLLDQALDSGIPIEIERNGRRLRIVPEAIPSKLDRVAGHPDYVVGDPEDLVHVDWSGEWQS